MREGRGLFLVLVLLVLSGCASGPEKFYDGPTRPAQDTATIVPHRGFKLHVDGQLLRRSASVLPGRHRIVVSNWNINGYVELDARAGRVYTVRTIPVKGGVRSWAVDLETCAVIAGTPPENLSTMKPTERGCAEEKISPEKIAAVIVALPFLIGALYVTGGNLPIGPWGPGFSGPDECADRCYAEPDVGEELTAKLLVPAWYRQADENCDAYFSSYRCLLEFDVDGLRVTKNKRAVMLSLGRHAVVLEAIAFPPGFWRGYFVGTDGLYLEAKANGVYALCVSPDYEERKIKLWIVDNKTGQVVVGQKRGFDAKEVSSYSRFCPIY